MYYFKKTNVESVSPNYLKESYSNKLKFMFKDYTEEILYRSFYKIEYLYLKEKLHSNKFIIYDIDYLKDSSKIVYVRLLGSNQLKKIKIPKLDFYYEDKDIYRYKRVYIWKTKSGYRKVYTFDKLVNRNEHRYYEIGDINKYGHKLIKITEESVYSHTYKSKCAVGLKF